MPLDFLPVTSPALAVLRLGRAMIEERGWARDRIQDAAGGVCAVCGITRSGSVSADGMSEAYGYLVKVIPSERGIADWNDAPGRTKADVLEAYDRAIDLAVADALVSR